MNKYYIIKKEEIDWGDNFKYSYVYYAYGSWEFSVGGAQRFDSEQEAINNLKLPTFNEIYLIEAIYTVL